MKQNIAFFYLKTGGGHYSGAKSISTRMQEIYGNNDINYFLKDGLDDCNKIFRLFFEDGYSLTSNSFELGYVFFYHQMESDINLKRMYKKFQPFVINKIKKFIEKNNITKIINFHHILTPIIQECLTRLNLNIPLITLVMDPFTSPPIWFYEKKSDLIVFSEKSKEEAIKKFNFDENKIHKFPIFFSNKFNQKLTDQEIINFKNKHSIPHNKKIVLIAGGGEGLKNANAILKKFLNNKYNEHIIIVCGKNKKLKEKLYRTKNKFKANNVTIFGFVSFMAELMKISDCVISKGGPATIMETLAVGKPLIISAFVRGQEYGNVFFVQKHDVGWYLEKPKQIYQKVLDITTNPALQKEITKKINNLNIKNGLDEVVEFLYNYKLK